QTLVWSGETTVRLPARPGRGGRARQLALSVARRLAGRSGWTLLVAGSDGVDGSDDAAGAIVDGATWAELAVAGVDGDAALAACDAGTALAAVGAAVVTGPTGVNHADLLVAHVAPRTC
ncbi:MAG: hydroxypyruvate reductase, partial [Kofleriaceae bacterium]|nr:hydroxypyruvate reductase [Kofleriaceae bacterium]